MKDLLFFFNVWREGLLFFVSRDLFALTLKGHLKVFILRNGRSLIYIVYKGYVGL